MAEQEIGVEKVMERIREAIQRKRSAQEGPTPTLDHPIAGFSNGQGAADVNPLHSLSDPRLAPITSHRRVLGSFMVAVKRILVKLLTPILERQTAYNVATARATADLGARLQALERRHGQALQAATDGQAATERLSADVTALVTALEGRHEQLRAGVADLRAQLRADLPARDAALRQELLATESGLRQALDTLRTHLGDEAGALRSHLGDELEILRSQLAGQARALVSARQSNAERTSAAERKLRRILHALNESRPPEDGVHTETVAGKPSLPARALEPEFDYAGFEERFRGTEEDIKERQRAYLPYFAGAQNVLDIGCGRGEFLELLQDSGIQARGVDLDLDMVLLCRDKALDVVRDDAFAYLGALPDDSLGGVFAAQVIEHLPTHRVIELVKLCHRKLAPGGRLILETPNPTCLMVFADSFYRDLSHIQPIHPDTMKFVLEASHFRQVEILALAPVDPAMKLPLLQGPDPALAEFNQGIERLNSLLFGFQDYGVIGQKGWAPARNTTSPGPDA